MSITASLIANVREAAGLDMESPTPLYQRLQQSLRQAVDGGVLTAGNAIPGERELAAGLGISRVTVRKAVQGLVIEGLLTQKQGAGTFVAPRVEQPLSQLTSFTEDMLARGIHPRTVWLNRSVSLATPQEAMALHLSPGSEVSRLYRIRSADDKPMALEQASLPRSILPDPLIVDESLYAALDKCNCRPVRALQHIRAQLCDDEHARLLKVKPGSAVLYIERRSFLRDGRAAEFTRSYYRGDSYDFVAELQIDAKVESVHR